MADPADGNAPVAAPPAAPAPTPPRSFSEYLRSFGPGIVIVLTWLGAGDVVDMGVAGSNYGYSLTWVLVVALIFRFIFVSLVARYQLCNQHGEGVLDGLVRLHRWYAPGLFATAFVMGHVYCSYMTVGVGEVCRNLFRVGEVWQWSLACNLSALILAFQPVFRRIEIVFLVFLGILSVSFLGSALWVGIDPAAFAGGFVSFEMPEQHGRFNPLLVAIAMIGAVGGSVMNLVYPYFIAAKGWRGPQFLRVQRYDLLLGIFVMILLNLAVWTLGAELLYPDRHITDLDDLPKLLSTVLGEGGRWLFYAGIFSAIYTSVVGHAVGLACLGSHAWFRIRHHDVDTTMGDHRQRPMYRWIVGWCLTTSLIWTLPGMPDFVTLTLIANSAQVVLLPVLAGGLWWITASRRFIGEAHRTRPWENVVMTALFLLAIYGAISSARAIAQYFQAA